MPAIGATLLFAYTHLALFFYMAIEWVSKCLTCTWAQVFQSKYNESEKFATIKLNNSALAAPFRARESGKLN